MWKKLLNNAIEVINRCFERMDQGRKEQGADSLLPSIRPEAGLPAASADIPMPPPQPVVTTRTRTLAWGGKVSAAFRKEIYLICTQLGWGDEHASWLMACIAFETGHSFDPAIKNQAGSGATGLIQFMPATARGLGTTTGDLAKMTAVHQLHYVMLYFKPYRRRIKTLPDMYMAILMPKYVGAPEHAVLFSEGVAYRQNSGLDTNRDGKITKEEATDIVQRRLVMGMLKENRLRETV